MNRVFCHDKTSIKKIIIFYLLWLIPLILYSIYKNGFLLYERDLISYFTIFKIIYLLIISFLIYLLVDKIIFKKNNFFTFDLLFVLIIPLFMPPNINIFLYAVGLLVSFILANILEKKLKFNKIAFCKLFIILLVILFGDYTYLNGAESLNIYALNYWDLLWGRNVGGIASTNIIFGLVILVIYSYFNNYKKNIALWSIGIFMLFSFLFSGYNIMSLLSSSAIVGLILLNVDSLSSPHNKKAMILCGVLIGFTTACLTIFVNQNEGVFISTLIFSFFSPILDKIFEK